MNQKSEGVEYCLNHEDFPFFFLPKTKFIRECQASVKESISEVHKKDDL